MIVRMIAITASLNASSRVLPISGLMSTPLATRSRSLRKHHGLRSPRARMTVYRRPEILEPLRLDLDHHEVARKIRPEEFGVAVPVKLLGLRMLRIGVNDPRPHYCRVF